MKVTFLAVALTIFLFQSCEIEQNAPRNLKSLSDEEQKVVDNNNNFAYRLFQAVSDTDANKNVFISPLSIGIALAMTYNGAADKTAEEMQTLLGFGELTKNDLNNSYQTIFEMLTGMDKKVELSLANSIWYNQGYTVHKSFQETIRKYYSAEIKPIDTGDPNSKNIMNQWVEDKTNNKIKDLINKVEPDDMMFLINAIYFKSEWTVSFGEKETYDGFFYKEDGTKQTCKMMVGKDIPYKTYSDSLLKMVELPYGNKQFSMMILLPESGLFVQKLAGRLNADYLNQIRKNSTEGESIIHMPKFKVEYEKELNEILKTMGMPRAFSSNAEFPNLFEEPEDLFISLVKHKSFIEVYEKGTEAAAATVVVMTRTSLDPTPAIYLNKPFIYLIIEKHTNTVLFIGKLLDLG